jgi:hypothetical protein
MGYSSPATACWTIELSHHNAICFWHGMGHYDVFVIFISSPSPERVFLTIPSLLATIVVVVVVLLLL